MKIRVSYSKTFNIGNYESEKISLELEEEKLFLAEGKTKEKIIAEYIYDSYIYLKVKVHELQDKRIDF